MDSPKTHQVNIGNIKKPVHDPINRADQTLPMVSDTSFQAYQKQILVGTPRTNAATIGRSDHQLDIF